MTSEIIGDSDSIFNPERVFPHHRSALTLLRGLVDQKTGCRWLDLACGRGQMYSQLTMSLRVEIRRKLRLYLHDGKDEHVAHALSVVEGKDLAAVHTSTGALSMFSSVYPRSRFDFVTFVNAVHEISPKALVSLLIDCVERLSRHGVLYISDMERLPIEALELGAITWSRDDIDLLLQPLYRPAEINTSRWPHTKEYSWDAILRRASLLARPRDATDRMNAVVTNVLEDRLEIARTSLERLTISKPISQQEEENRRRLLYDYWAISRALNERT